MLLDRGVYVYDNQHPPLARLAAAVGPYLAGARSHGNTPPSGEEEGRAILYHSAASYDTLLTLARLGMLPFLVILVFSTWIWVRRWQGAGAALLTIAFMISTPPILGNAGVVALDVPVTALCILSFYMLLRWIELPSWRNGLWLGLACGLAISTKLSAIPFIGLAAMGLLVAQYTVKPVTGQPLLLRERLLTSGLALLVLLVTIVAVYGKTMVYLATPDLKPNSALDLLVGHSGWLHDVGYRLAARYRVPLGMQEVPLNILGIEWHNMVGHPSFLLGETRRLGWWYFYLVALAVKTPLPLLLLGLPGLALLAVRGWRERQLALLAPPLCFTVILVFCCLYSHINIGVRHVLVLYPLLAMGAASAVVACWHAWRRWQARGLIVALALWQFSTVVSAYPDYLAYFNFTAGDHPERILVDSDLDWGQDLRRLSRELARRHISDVFIAYRGTADLTREHLPTFRLLKPGQRVNGWIAIDMLSLKEERAGYGWLAAYTPVQRVGKSIDLYDIRGEAP